MHSYSQNIIESFASQSNAERAAQQKAYMKNKFEFFGLTSEVRKNALKLPFAKANRPQKQELKEVILDLWNCQWRECQYAAQELFMKYHKQLEREDVELFEFMVQSKSWWDTIDYISSNLMGSYFKAFPDQKQKYVTKWLKSNNIWLQRCTLLFQLKYKQELDTVLLSRCIRELNGGKEFFINKAIGWSLRQHSKHDPNWVREFISTHQLNPLSVREGSKYI